MSMSALTGGDYKPVKDTFFKCIILKENCFSVMKCPLVKDVACLLLACKQVKSGDCCPDN